VRQIYGSLHPAGDIGINLDLRHLTKDLTWVTSFRHDGNSYNLPFPSFAMQHVDLTIHELVTI